LNDQTYLLELNQKMVVEIYGIDWKKLVLIYKRVDVKRRQRHYLLHLLKVRLIFTNNNINVLPVLGEANQLAIDFRSVCETEFPVKITADYVARHYSDPNEISTRRNMILAARYCLLSKLC
jgi:hypothetical protein